MQLDNEVLRGVFLREWFLAADVNCSCVSDGKRSRISFNGVYAMSHAMKLIKLVSFWEIGTVCGSTRFITVVCFDFRPTTSVLHVRRPQRHKKTFVGSQSFNSSKIQMPILFGRLIEAYPCILKQIFCTRSMVPLPVCVSVHVCACVHLDLSA